VKAIAQGSIGHTGIVPKAFFNGIGHFLPHAPAVKAAGHFAFLSG
jgi:hypothetical protein